MVEKKRSLGVTIFAWLFIVLGTIGLLGIRNTSRYYPFLSKFALWTMTFYFIGNNVASIVAGIHILKLKQWARKLGIILAMLGILFMITISVPLAYNSVKKLASSTEFIQSAEEKYDSMPEDHIRKKKISKEEYINWSINLIKKMYYTVLIILGAFQFLIIIFFTRPKVKEQFT